MIYKYNDFIIESKIANALNEGLLAYSKGFSDILNYISDDKIANTLLKFSSEECNISLNYITVSSEVGSVRFIQDNRLDKKDLFFRLTNHYRFVKEGFDTFIKSKFSKIGLQDGYNRMSNRFRLLDSVKFDKKTVYHIQFLQDESKYAVVYSFDEDTDALLEVVDDVDDTKGTEIKIGRLVGKILTSLKVEYTSENIEKFVNRYISASHIANNIFDKFSIVSGEDLRKAYLFSNYYDSTKARQSQLWKSCMSYTYCQRYLDIYVKNPDRVSLLIFKNDDDKILGRALLWKLDDNTLYMDRIYTVSDSYNYTFEEWGTQNGYELNRSYQDEFTVTIEPNDYEPYPYMDTLQYYNIESGILSSESGLLDGDYICLTETDGGYSG